MEQNLIPCPSWGIYTVSGVPYIHQVSSGLGKDFSGRVNSPYKVTTNTRMLKAGCPHNINFSKMCEPKWIPDQANVVFWSYIPNWIEPKFQNVLIESLNPINLHPTLARLQLLGSVVSPEATLVIEERTILTKLRAQLNLTNITPFTSLNYKESNPHLWWEVSNLVVNCQRPMVFVGDKGLFDYSHILRVPYPEGGEMVKEAQRWMKEHLSNLSHIGSLPDLGSFLIYNLKNNS